MSVELNIGIHAIIMVESSVVYKCFLFIKNSESQHIGTSFYTDVNRWLNYLGSVMESCMIQYLKRGSWVEVSSCDNGDCEDTVSL